MTRYAAFGDEGRKQALLADIRASGPVAAEWLSHQAFEADLTPVSRDFGLHPGYARLLPGLAAHGQAPGSPEFYASAIEALPVGADTGRLARQVLLMAWDHPQFGMARKVAAGPFRDAAEAVVALVRKSVDGPVDKKEWRAARAALARAQEAGGDESADLVLSMAWNLDDTPGAAQDVLLSWSSLIWSEAHAADPDALTQAESETLFNATRRFHEEAIGTLGELKPGDLEGYEKYQALMKEKWGSAADLKGLKDRQDAQMARVTAKRMEWLGLIQRDFLQMSRAVPVMSPA